MPTECSHQGDPLAFALNSLAARGALVESGADRGTAILPAELARELDIPEECELLTSAEGDNTVGCGLGSSLLDHLILRARTGVHYARIKASLDPPRSTRARSLAEVFVVRNGVTEVIECLVGSVEYQLLAASWVAEADDRHEGLVYAALGARGGQPDPRVERALWTAVRGTFADFREMATNGSTSVPDDDDAAASVVRGNLSRLRQVLERRALDATDPLREGILRRQAREYRQITEYYRAMVSEVQQPRRKIDPATLKSRLEAVVADRDAKLRDLEQRFHMRVTLTPVAQVFATVATTTVRLRVRRRQSDRILELSLPIEAQSLDLLGCEGCLGFTGRPALCDQKLHVLCEACVPEARGRVHCPACAKNR